MNPDGPVLRKEKQLEGQNYCQKRSHGVAVIGRRRPTEVLPVAEIHSSLITAAQCLASLGCPVVSKLQRQVPAESSQQL